MTVRDDRGDVKQTTTGFRGPLMVQSLTSAKSKFLSLRCLWFAMPPARFSTSSGLIYILLIFCGKVRFEQFSSHLWCIAALRSLAEINDR